MPTRFIYSFELSSFFNDGNMIFLDDYKSMRGYGIKLANIKSAASEKGQLEEIKAFAEAIRDGKASPIPLWQQCQAMRIAFAVEEQI